MRASAGHKVSPTAFTVAVLASPRLACWMEIHGRQTKLALVQSLTTEALV